jgi:tripartite-type tricarboxylate transporter receptor subunit TctC
MTGAATDRRFGGRMPREEERMTEDLRTARPHRRGVVRAGLAAAAATVAAAPASFAQPFPSRPVRIIVPFAPGGGTDIAARLIAERLTAAWGRPVVVENRSGAAGTIGTAVAAAAEPDGHTVALVTQSHSINAALFPSLPFDPVRGFAPIGLVATYAYLFVVNPDLPVRTLAELVDHVKARPGQMMYASTGSGSPNHLAMEILMSATGMRLTQVPYRGSAPALQDVVANNVPMLIDPLVTSLPLVRAGRLRALAVTTPERSALAPEVPTVAEASGIPGFDLTGWLGLLAPAGTPPGIVARCNADVGAILRSPEVSRRLEELGQSPRHSTPEEFAALIAQDIERWRPVIQATGAKPSD